MTELAKTPLAKTPLAKTPLAKTPLDTAAQGAAREPEENADEHGDVADLPFEKALAELETIVRRLEGGEVPLEESIAIYERGEALKARCEALLKLAETRIERITLSAQGKPSETTPLDET